MRKRTDLKPKYTVEELLSQYKEQQAIENEKDAQIRALRAESDKASRKKYEIYQKMGKYAWDAIKEGDFLVKGKQRIEISLKMTVTNYAYLRTPTQIGGFMRDRIYDSWTHTIDGFLKFEGWHIEKAKK